MGTPVLEVELYFSYQPPWGIILHTAIVYYHALGSPTDITPTGIMVSCNVVDIHSKVSWYYVIGFCVPVVALPVPATWYVLLLASFMPQICHICTALHSNGRASSFIALPGAETLQAALLRQATTAAADFRQTEDKLKKKKNQPVGLPDKQDIGLSLQHIQRCSCYW